MLGASIARSHAQPAGKPILPALSGPRLPAAIAALCSVERPKGEQQEQGVRETGGAGGSTQGKGRLGASVQRLHSTTASTQLTRAAVAAAIAAAPVAAAAAVAAARSMRGLEHWQIAGRRGTSGGGRMQQERWHGHHPAHHMDNPASLQPAPALQGHQCREQAGAAAAHRLWRPASRGTNWPRRSASAGVPGAVSLCGTARVTEMRRPSSCTEETAGQQEGLGGGERGHVGAGLPAVGGGCCSQTSGRPARPPSAAGSAAGHRSAGSRRSQANKAAPSRQPSTHLCVVQAVDGRILVTLVAKDDKAKAAGAPRHLVHHHHRVGGVELRKGCVRAAGRGAAESPVVARGRRRAAPRRRRAATAPPIGPRDRRAAPQPTWPPDPALQQATGGRISALWAARSPSRSLASSRCQEMPPT